MTQLCCFNPDVQAQYIYDKKLGVKVSIFLLNNYVKFHAKICTRSWNINGSDRELHFVFTLYITTVLSKHSVHKHAQCTLLEVNGTLLTHSSPALLQCHTQSTTEHCLNAPVFSLQMPRWQDYIVHAVNEPGNTSTIAAAGCAISAPWQRQCRGHCNPMRIHLRPYISVQLFALFTASASIIQPQWV